MNDITVPIFIFMGLFAAIVFGANEMERAQCSSTASAMGLEYRYSILTPCLVNVDGKFIPLDAYRVNDVRKD